MSIDFKIKKSKIINDVRIIYPSIACDNRGNIWTSFINDEIDPLLPGGLSFKHDKFSLSINNVLRGIHGDYKTWKLITCVYGEIHQVVVDLRKKSLSFMKWEKFIINKNSQCLILIPPGVGNAYYVTSDQAVYHYKLAYSGKYVDTYDQFTHPWNDTNLNIDWPTDKPILSSRDNISIAK